MLLTIKTLSNSFTQSLGVMHENIELKIDQ